RHATLERRASALATGQALESADRRRTCLGHRNDEVTATEDEDVGDPAHPRRRRDGEDPGRLAAREAPDQTTEIAAAERDGVLEDAIRRGGRHAFIERHASTTGNFSAGARRPRRTYSRPRTRRSSMNSRTLRSTSS